MILVMLYFMNVLFNSLLAVSALKAGVFVICDLSFLLSCLFSLSPFLVSLFLIP